MHGISRGARIKQYHVRCIHAVPRGGMRNLLRTTVVEIATSRDSLPAWPQGTCFAVTAEYTLRLLVGMPCPGEKRHHYRCGHRRRLRSAGPGDRRRGSVGDTARGRRRKLRVDTVSIDHRPLTGRREGSSRLAGPRGAPGEALATPFLDAHFGSSR